MKICKLLLRVLVCGLLFLTCSCMTPQKKPSICETNTAPSFLCELAEKHNTTLEEIGAVLIVSNAVGIGSGAYGPEDAIKVLEAIRDVLENPVSYLFFRTQVKKQFWKYPALFQIADIYIQEFASPQIMHPFDQAILQSWINSRIRSMEDLKLWPR